jgi:hypothetical protein
MALSDLNRESMKGRQVTVCVRKKPFCVPFWNSLFSRLAPRKMRCGRAATVSNRFHDLAPLLTPINVLNSVVCALADCMHLLIALLPQRRPKRHDDHRLRNQSEPDPEKPRSYVAHLDAQHRLDGTTLNLAGRAFRARARWLRQHPLNNCQASALGIRG